MDALEAARIRKRGHMKLMLKTAQTAVAISKPKVQVVPDPAVEGEVPDYKTIVGLRKSNIANIALEHAQIAKQMGELKVRLDGLKEEGKALMLKAGVKSCLVDGGIKVTRSESHSTKLDKAKFAQLAGTKGLKWLADATVSTPYTTLLITVPKPRDMEEGEGA